ncbi:hypothetical protein GALMADRAFT_277498 [Galerina marginata CBS 339.88]|uniref:Uncharacterized protein n=1 Tax=Galerina marginata (strain CBS 339.88) TaxID=685588 RepID=A0A067TAN9_GALM3|nr:hypothetical protein GALMADRAFT_277498 [Galerina marginata CBS 339.88]
MAALKYYVGTTNWKLAGRRLEYGIEIGEWRVVPEKAGACVEEVAWLNRSSKPRPKPEPGPEPGPLGPNDGLGPGGTRGRRAREGTVCGGCVGGAVGNIEGLKAMVNKPAVLLPLIIVVVLSLPLLEPRAYY